MQWSLDKLAQVSSWKTWLFCRRSVCFFLHSLAAIASLCCLESNASTTCWAQTGQAPPIRIETREVAIPVLVLEAHKDPRGVLLGPTGEQLHVWVYYTQEVAGLSAKSFHIFEDGAEQKIQHFSIEPGVIWPVRDNLGEHIEHSWTPKGIWSAPDRQKLSLHSLHVYLITYVPPQTLMGSCHRITLKVSHKNTRILAPDQYCNTQDPLSDTLNETAVGNRLLEYAKLAEPNSIPFALQLSAFPASSDNYRINLSAEFPPSLFHRQWKENQLILSVAILGLVYDNRHVLVARFSESVCAPSECGVWLEGAVPPDNVSIPEFKYAEQSVEDLIIPVSYRTQLELQPGDYQVELLITDGEKFGHAEALLNIDDFKKQDLAISGLALCKRYRKSADDERGPTRAPQYVPLILDGMEFVPAGDTRFKKGEKLFVYFEIARSDAKSASTKIYLEMKVTDEKTNQIKLGTGARLIDPVQSENSVIPMVWDMEIAKLPAGSYRLEVQASDSTGHKTGWRMSSFVIE
jgi:hypothetical protein